MSDIEIPIDLEEPEGITPDALDEWVKGGDWETDPVVSPPGAEVELEDEVPAPSPLAPSVADDDLVRLSDDLALSRAEARTLYELSQDLAHNPELARAIADYYQAKQTPPVQAPPPEIPIDLSDPATKWFYDQQQLALSQVTALRQELDQRTGSIAQVLQTRQAQENSAIIDRVKSDFAAARNLTPDELKQLDLEAARLQIFPALMNQGLDMYTAAEKALDTAYWSNDLFRQRAINTQTEQSRADTTRKRKLAAVGGNSGSSPRQAPVPKNDEERRQAMIAEVAQLMAGNE